MFDRGLWWFDGGLDRLKEVLIVLREFLGCLRVVWVV